MTYQSDYEFYTNQMTQDQDDSNALNDLLGFPRTDLAHAKAIQRQLAKSRPTFKQLKAKFGFEVACAKFEQVLNGKDVTC